MTQALRVCAVRAAIAVALLVPASPVDAQDASARIADVWPSVPAWLPPREPFFVRIAYESSQPVRVQARGWWDGEEIPAMTNPSPVYPAGKGEAIAWVAFEDGKSIDEIHVTVSDNRWQPLVEMSQPASVGWSLRAPSQSRPGWVETLNSAQQNAVGQAAAEAGDTSGPMGLLLSGIFLLVPAYPVLQILALVRLSGTPRQVAMLPLLAMVPIWAFCIYALGQGSNLWPLPAIFASIPASIVLGCALLFGRRTA